MSTVAWKGAPFFIDKYELVESSAEKEIQVLRATRRVASLSVLGSAALLFIAMLHHSSWLVSSSNPHLENERAFVGPHGMFVGQSELSFFNCPVTFGLAEGTKEWMQFYGVCASGPLSPSLWWWSLLFGWSAVVLMVVGPLLGMLLAIMIRIEAILVMVGEMCALSSLICFLNWNYVADLLFEHALIFSLNERNEIVLLGPVGMHVNWPLVVFLMGLFSCFFSLISLMVVSRSVLRDQVIAKHL